MEFDWINPSFDLSLLPPKEIEESFEDPFCLKILPDLETEDSKLARYFLLGKSVSNKAIFSVFWTNGKKYRIIFSRLMTQEEQDFYTRLNAQNL